MCKRVLSLSGNVHDKNVSSYSCTSEVHVLLVSLIFGQNMGFSMCGYCGLRGPQKPSKGNPSLGHVHRPPRKNNAFTLLPTHSLNRLPLQYLFLSAAVKIDRRRFDWCSLPLICSAFIGLQSLGIQ